MGNRFLDLATWPATEAEQLARGSRTGCASSEGPAENIDRLTEDEVASIKARDIFHLATVTSDSWPYIKHRGGLPKFLQLLDDRHLCFADLRGSRQYLALGSIASGERVALVLMDYPNRRPLKLLGQMRPVAAEQDPELTARLTNTTIAAYVECLMTITVEAFDWTVR